MTLKNFLTKVHISSSFHWIYQCLATIMNGWYGISVKKIPQENASLEQKEAFRRGRFASNFLLIFLIIMGLNLPIIILEGNIQIALIYPSIVISQVIAILANRKGRCSIAGFIIMMNFELIVIIFILAIAVQSGIDITTLPLFDFLLIPTLFAVSLLPAWVVFPVSASNTILVVLALQLLPKTSTLQTFLLSSRDQVYAIPIILQCITAAISFVWVRNAMKTIKEASRADTLDDLYRQQTQVAQTDAITGLPNHRTIMNHLQEAIEDCKQGEEIYTLMFVDLDHFKQINDTWGHVAGDTVLREAATRLQATLGAEGFVGRYGGEEFAILLKEAKSDRAYWIAEEVRATLARTPCTWQAETTQEAVKITITASIGIALYGLHGESAEKLLECADHAMYQAKQQGRNRVCIAELEEEPKGQIQLVEAYRS